MITLQIALLGSHNTIYMHILVTVSDMLKFQNHLLLGVLLLVKLQNEGEKKGVIQNNFLEKPLRKTPYSSGP